MFNKNKPRRAHLLNAGIKKMVRKKNCPNCGSRKISQKDNELICNVCGVEFSGKSRGRTSKKGRKQW